MSDLQTLRNKAVTINLDGKDRTLIYDLNAFADLEEVYGDLNSMLTALQSGSIKAVRKFLYVGFLHDDENITEREVGKMFDMSNIEEVTKKLEEAMTKALPPVEEKEDEQDPNEPSPVAE